MTQSTNKKCEWLILGVPVGESCAISTSGRESDRTGNTAKKEEISVSRGVADVGTKMVEERERERHTFMNLALWQPCPADSADSLKFPLLQSDRSQAVTKNSRTDPQCRWLTQQLLLCRAVSVQFYPARMRTRAKPSESEREHDGGSYGFVARVER